MKRLLKYTSVTMLTFEILMSLMVVVTAVSGLRELPQKECVTAPNLKQFRAEVLKAHNTLRAKHGAKALKPDEELTAQAQHWAEKASVTGKLHYSSLREINGHPHGQNIYSAQGNIGSINGEHVTKHWYDESKYYKGGNKAMYTTGQFTQVVWKNTKRIGVGVAVSGDCKSIFVVVNYDPPGNVVNEVPKNVQVSGT